MDSITETAHPLDGPTPQGWATPLPALIVLWSKEEGERVGEVILLDPAQGPRVLLGRGERPAEDGIRRAQLCRQWPGYLEQRGPLRSRALSRQQLSFVVQDDGALTVTNVGRSPLLHNGKAVTTCQPGLGDILEVEHSFLFLVTTRPALLPGAVGNAAPSHVPACQRPFGHPDAHGIVGEGVSIHQLRSNLFFAAQSAQHTLIRGPSGSGKELAARAIHAASPRNSGPFVSRNAATFPEGLIDAELFGNVRGFPNPGMPARPGLLGQAHGGTLFLDEIGELPQALQARLLRVMDAGEYQRLGEAEPRRSDFTLVAASNRPDNAFKHDVLARFKVRVSVPGLNERREDIPLLMTHLLAHMPTSRPPATVISPHLIRRLTQHHYTTHVRELERLLILAEQARTSSVLNVCPAVEAELSQASPIPQAPRPAVSLTARETQRLSLLQAHQFNASACGVDPAYPGNRQRADLHIRQLIAKLLALTHMDADATLNTLCVKGDTVMSDRLHRRIHRFIDGLTRRARAASNQGDEASAALRQAVSREYRGYGRYVLDLLEVVARAEP